MFSPRFQLGCTGNDRPRSIGCRPQNHKKQNRKRSLPDIWIANREPKAAPISAGRCPASKTCAWCAARDNTPTIFRWGQAYAVLVRTPHAHAESRGRHRGGQMPVIAVLTGADYR
jgi:hypothetical protein